MKVKKYDELNALKGLMTEKKLHIETSQAKPELALVH